MKYKRIIISVIAISLLLSVGLIGNFLLCSQSGAQFVFKTLAKKIPDFKYGKVSGRLLGELEISQLKYHSNFLDLNIEHLSTHNAFNFLKLKLLIKELTIENATVNGHIAKFNNNPSGSGTNLPIIIEANKIILKNIILKNDDNTIIAFPTLIGTADISRQKKHLFIYKEQDERFFLKLDQSKKIVHLDIHSPFHKADCKLHYSGTKKRYILHTEINDDHQGNLILEANGKRNAHFIHLNSNDLHLDDFGYPKLTGILSTDVKAKHDKKTTEISLKQLSGIINGQPIEGAGEVFLPYRKSPLVRINLHSKNARVIVGENLNTPQQINWILNISRIEDYFPTAKGGLIIKGDVNHINTHPTFTLDLRGSNLSFNQHKIDKLSFQGSGNEKNHWLKLDVSAKGQAVSLHVLGKYEPNKWGGIIDHFSISNKKQHWELHKHATITINKRSIAVHHLLLREMQNQIALSGIYSFNDNFKGRLEAKNIDLSLLDFTLPEHMRLDGKLNLSAAVDSKKHKLNVLAELSPGTFYYQINSPEKNSFSGGKFKSYMKGDDLFSDLSITFPDGHVTSNIVLQKFSLINSNKNQKIAGRVNLLCSQLKILEILIPAIKNMTGKIIASYDISGTLSKPLISGNLNLANGNFQIPKLNLTVSNVNLHAKSNNSTVTYNGSLMSGRGTLFINGDSKIEKNAMPLNLNLHGINVLICDQPEIKIFANPNMHLTLEDKTLKLSGKILIPEANIHPHDFGSAESASDDIVFIETSGKKIENSNLRIISSIDLSLGNKIYLNSRGIKGQVRGQIEIEDDPMKATIANGELWLQDGSYTIYGKTLQIDNGRLLFSGGPISNPGLNIKASRMIQAQSNSLFTGEENIRVGVQVTGTLHEPKINLFSEPTGKNQADILSYLVLGMPVNSLNQSVSKSNTQLLLQAADALNLSGNSKLLNLKNQLKKGLGLSELDIGTQSEIDPHTQETVQHTAFVLGKYLSPKFYINYSLDLFDHTNTLKLRYLLNKFWTIQSVANSNGSGIDILYTVEK